MSENENPLLPHCKRPTTKLFFSSFLIKKSSFLVNKKKSKYFYSNFFL